MLADRRPQSMNRSGTAAVECGVVLAFLLAPLMIGTWEVGRLVFCQQVIVTACREGARIAAQGKTVNSSGDPTDITISTAGTPNVRDTVYFALITGGLSSLSDRAYVHGQTQFAFLTPYVKKDTTDPDPTEPHNAQKGQPFRVSLTIHWSRVRYVNLGIVRPNTITYQVDWTVLVDDPFNVNTTLPTWTVP
jgi:Flp pilus assembly protein TadG